MSNERKRKTVNLSKEDVFTISQQIAWQRKRKNVYLSKKVITFSVLAECHAYEMSLIYLICLIAAKETQMVKLYWDSDVAPQQK